MPREGVAVHLLLEAQQLHRQRERLLRAELVLTRVLRLLCLRGAVVLGPAADVVGAHGFLNASHFPSASSPIAFAFAKPSRASGDGAASAPSTACAIAASLSAAKRSVDVDFG